MDAVEQRVSDILSQRWTFLLLRGIAAIAFGVLTWLRPGLSLATLVFLFGAYALLDGILATTTAIEGRHTQEHWWLLLLAGLVGVGVGILTFMTPGRKIPTGRRWVAYFSLPILTECPALAPPQYRATTSACSVRKSTIFPLPSSPHWSPTTQLLPSSASDTTYTPFARGGKTPPGFDP